MNKIIDSIIALVALIGMIIYANSENLVLLVFYGFIYLGAVINLKSYE